MRTIKEEEVDVSDYATYADATRHIGRFLDEVYMLQQHSFLGYLTPVEFESQWRQEAFQTCEGHTQELKNSHIEVETHWLSKGS